MNLLKTIWRNLRTIHKEKSTEVYTSIRLYRQGEFIEWFALVLRPGSVAKTSDEGEYGAGYGLEVKIL